MEPLIQVQDLVKVYSLGEVEVQALRSISLSVDRGEFVAIMGASGSGKSTLLNLISCLDTPTQGEVYIEGMPISSLNGFERARLRREKLGFVFQQFNLIRSMTSYENIELPMRFKGTPRSERKRRIQELLSLVELESKGGNRPTELSGGEQQRVAIARALVNNPKIILADEPTGNLDTKTGATILELLKGLNREERRTLVIVTHDPRIAKIASQQVKLQDGKIIPN